MRSTIIRSADKARRNEQEEERARTASHNRKQPAELASKRNLTRFCCCSNNNNKATTTNTTIMSEDQRDHSNKRRRLVHAVLNEVYGAVAPALKKQKKNHHHHHPTLATAASSRLLVCLNKHFVLKAFAALQSFFAGPKRLNDLEKDPYQYILSFLDFANRQTLTLVSKRAKLEVEEYSENVYNKIKQQHAVDDTFHLRVGDQTKLRTVRIKPVVLPWRYLLFAALRNYLYKIQLKQRKQRGLDDLDLIQLRLSPSQDRLAVITAAGGNAALDLSTQSVLSGIVLPFDEFVMTPFLRSFEKQVWLDDDRVATYCPFADYLYIYTAGNGSAYPVDLGNWSYDFWSSVAPSARSTDELYFFKKDAATTPPRIYCCTIDISEWARQGEWRHQHDPSAAVTELFHVQGDFGSTACLFVVNNFIVFGLEEDDYGGKIDFYVFNLETNRRCQHFSFFDPLVQASDCPTTFYSLLSEKFSRKCVIVWHLCEDGCLRERQSIPVQGRSIEAASTTHVLVRDPDGIHLYNITNARGPPRSFRPCRAAVISNARKELLIADGRRNTGEPDEVSVRTTIVRAFCMEEPRM